MLESPGTCYQCYTTTGKSTQNPVPLHLWESLQYLNQFQCILTIFSPHTTHSMHYWKSTSLLPQKPMANAIFPHKVRKEKVWEPIGELIRLSDVISQDQKMTRLT